MTLTATQYALWIGGFLAHALAVVVMLRLGSYRRWPSLFCLAALDVAVDLLVFTAAHHYPIYFYAYWGATIVRAFLGLWLIFDIIRALPNIKYAPRSLALGFVSLAITLAIGSAWMASSGGTHTFHIMMMAFTLVRCTSVLWGTFAVTLFFAVGFCGAGWTPMPLRMGATLLVWVLVMLFDSHALSKWPTHSLEISNIFSFCKVGIWISWSGIMRKEQSDAPAKGYVFPFQTACRER